MAGAMIEYTANGGTARGYLAKPEGGGTGKGVIVVQEWWGLVPHIMDVAERFAREGFTALAPDLWDGKRATTPDQAERLFMALNIDDAAKKLRSAAAALRDQGGASGAVGVVGFCMGGQLALYTAAALGRDAAACVDFYGIHPAVKPDFGNLTAPVLGIFGEQDPMITPDAARELVATVKAAGAQMESHSYPAGHAFFNDTRPDVHDPASSADAWRRTIEFLQKHL